MFTLYKNIMMKQSELCHRITYAKPYTPKSLLERIGSYSEATAVARSADTTDRENARQPLK